MLPIIDLSLIEDGFESISIGSIHLLDHDILLRRKPEPISIPHA
jgi:hypothetical protein